MNVAQLKHLRVLVDRVDVDPFPRLNERGSIEADRERDHDDEEEHDVSTFE